MNLAVKAIEGRHHSSLGTPAGCSKNSFMKLRLTWRARSLISTLRWHTRRFQAAEHLGFRGRKTSRCRPGWKWIRLHNTLFARRRGNSGIPGPQGSGGRYLLRWGRIFVWRHAIRVTYRTAATAGTETNPTAEGYVVAPKIRKLIKLLLPVGRKRSAHNARGGPYARRELMGRHSPRTNTR